VKFNKTISRVNDVISKCKSKNELFREVCDVFASECQIELVCIKTLNKEDANIECVATAGAAKYTISGCDLNTLSFLSFSSEPSAAIAYEGIDYIIHDCRTTEVNALWSASMKNASLASMAVFPIKRSGKPIALFALYSKLVGHFEGDLLAVVREVASNLSLAIEAI
jgi:GAF domain-containing protein